MRSDDFSTPEEVLLEQQGPRQPLSYQRLETVLVVEDDPDLGHALETRLGKEGWNVSVAGDGQCGIEEVERLEPDIVLLDLGLPRMNGFRVLEEIRRSPLTDRVPIVVITGRSDPELERKMENWGVSAVFRKPVELAEVVEAVAEVLDGGA